VSRVVLAELLRFIAANEELPRVQKRYPGYDRDTIGKLINAAAARLEESEPGAGSGPAMTPSKGLRVRKVSEVEKSARAAAEDLDASMNLSRVEQERLKRERAAAAEQVRQEQARPARAPRTRLFTDGAARGNPGPAGAGAVIVSPEGHIVAKVGKFLGDNTNNFAEYMGLILGLKRAKAMGIKELDVFADSELIVRQLNGEYQVKAENLKPLHQEARQLLAAFPAVEIRYIPREQNAAADEMSNRAIDERL
jgi:ribonuclease HI